MRRFTMLPIFIAVLASIVFLPATAIASPTQSEANAVDETLLFEDDFSSDRGWIDESNGHFYRDETHEWLYFATRRSDPRRYYYPIDASADSIRLQYRFNVTDVSGNGGVIIGLVEDLYSAEPSYRRDFNDATGFFTRLSRFGDFVRWKRVTAAAQYNDRDWYGFPRDFPTFINFQSLNAWRQVDLVIDSLNWTLTVSDNSGNQLGQLSGTMPAQHREYQYIMIFRDESPGSESARGHLDDIRIYGSPVNTPPDCSEVVPSVDTLWPPNHEFVPIDVLGVTDPDGDAISLTIDSIFQDEAVDIEGSGDTGPDGQGVGASAAEVRAERAGSGNGRVYHIGFTADDGHGGVCTGEVLVGVPMSQGKNDVPVDDGALYDSMSTGS
jgi:hypothetical protein